MKQRRINKSNPKWTTTKTSVVTRKDCRNSLVSEGDQTEWRKGIFNQSGCQWGKPSERGGPNFGNSNGEIKRSWLDLPLPYAPFPSWATDFSLSCKKSFSDGHQLEGCMQHFYPVSYLHDRLFPGADTAIPLSCAGRFYLQLLPTLILLSLVITEPTKSTCQWLRHNPTTFVTTYPIDEQIYLTRLSRWSIPSSVNV